MKIMLTGATGFIGGHLARILKDENFKFKNENFKLLSSSRGGDYKLNIHDFNAVNNFLRRERPDYLVHLAWNVDSEYQAKNENFDWVLSSLNLLRAFYENGGKRAVFAGSCMEYDWRYGFLSEDVTPLSPDTFYGFTKNILYKMASEYAVKNNFSFAWGRIFFLYGNGEKEGRLVPSLIKNPGKLKYPFIKRDYMYVGDVAAAFVAILMSGFNGAVNIASGSAVSLCEIADKIAALTGRDPEKYFYDEAINNDANNKNAPAPLVLADTRILNNVIKFRPKFSLDEGLNETIKFYI